jgi:hypothetical protein
MRFFNLFKKAERIAELKSENKKLVEDNHAQYEEHSKMMDRYHETAMELEQLKVEYEALKQKLIGSGSAQIAHDHKVYQDGMKQGRELMAESLRNVLNMRYDELVDWSDVLHTHGEMWVTCKDVNDSIWEVHDRICQYGGCDMPTICNDEMVARTYVAVMNMNCIPLIRDVCDECKKEYYSCPDDDEEDED